MEMKNNRNAAFLRRTLVLAAMFAAVPAGLLAQNENTPAPETATPAAQAPRKPPGSRARRW